MAYTQMAWTAPPLPALPRPPRLYARGLCAGLFWPDVPLHEIERIRGRKHVSTYCREEACKEYATWLIGEDYHFRSPEIDGEGYLLTSTEIGTHNLESLMVLYRNRQAK